VTVTAVNDAPSFTKGADQTVIEDAGAQTVAGWATAISAGPADESAQTLNFIVTNGNNALFSAQPAVSAAGTLTYTSAAGATGSATVTVQLHDNGGTANGGVDTSAAQTFTITVNAVNHAPVAVNDSYSTTQGTALTVAAAGVLTNDTDVDAGDTKIAVLVTSPANGTLTLNANGGFTYTPNAAFAGTDTFQYQAKDAANALSNVATVTITVTASGGNHAPVANNDAYTVNQNSSLTVATPGVLANDTDVDPGDTRTAVLASGGSPAHGTLILNANGSFRYTPTTGFSGTDTFSYQAKDAAGALSNVATVTITVSPLHAGFTPAMPFNATGEMSGAVHTTRLEYVVAALATSVETHNSVGHNEVINDWPFALAAAERTRLAECRPFETTCRVAETHK